MPEAARGHRTVRVLFAGIVRLLRQWRCSFRRREMALGLRVIIQDIGWAARRHSIAGCLFTPVTSRGLQPGLSEGWVDRLTNPSSCTPQRLLMLPHAVRTGHK